MEIAGYFGCSGESFWLARGIKSKQPRTCDVRFLNIRFLILSPLPMPLLKREYNAVSAIADEIWQYRMGGNLTIFDKDHDTVEDRSRTAEVLAAKHTASLQLLCTVGGNQARSDARTEFKNLEPSPKGGGKLVVHRAVASAAKFQIRYAYPISPDCHQLYIVIVANACGYTQGPFWLPWRIALVG